MAVTTHNVRKTSKAFISPTVRLIDSRSDISVYGLQLLNDFIEHFTDFIEHLTDLIEHLIITWDPSLKGI